MTPETSPRDRVSRVGALLETMGDALVEGRAEALLQVEQELGPAVQTLAALAGHSTTSESGDQDRLRAALVRCRAALVRCRRLGASLEQFTTATLEAEGHSGAYTRLGLAPTALPTAGLQVRG